MNIITIISRDPEKGSTEYRLIQYLEFLSKKGINIEFINRTELSRMLNISVSAVSVSVKRGEKIVNDNSISLLKLLKQ
jgi:hypothetical protein